MMRPPLIYPLAVAALLVLPCQGFVTVGQRDLVSSPRTSTIILADGPTNGDHNNGDEPDLFEYFDPLRSPHDYPDGIDPDHKPVDRSSESSADDKPKMPAGLDLLGFMGGPVLPLEEVSEPSNDSSSLSEDQPKFASSTNSDKEEEVEEVDILEVFDPTLSPHAYPNGIPSTKKKKKSTKTVGIILMDHGSKKESSNQRLHDLAQLYQQTFSGSGEQSTVIVKAAHMEIASPSIPEVLELLIKENQVDEIVCHPYFLSPGRHATQDIPEIIEQAMKELGISVPVITTKPVGSSTDLMVRAIHSLVTESSIVLQEEDNGNDGRMGFF